MFAELIIRKQFENVVGVIVFQDIVRGPGGLIQEILVVLKDALPFLGCLPFLTFMFSLKVGSVFMDRVVHALPCEFNCLSCHVDMRIVFHVPAPLFWNERKHAPFPVRHRTVRSVNQAGSFKTDSKGS